MICSTKDGARESTKGGTDTPGIYTSSSKKKNKKNWLLPPKQKEHRFPSSAKTKKNPTVLLIADFNRLLLDCRKSTALLNRRESTAIEQQSKLGEDQAYYFVTQPSPFFLEFKKQASFFLKEKIKTARLALTDVTPVQLLTEEATKGNPGVPDTRTLKMISRAAFEIDDYWRIVDILHKRKTWRVSYKALIVLEHLLTHGPERVAEEFQIDKDAIRETGSLQYIDEKGFNWGLNVKRKSERILELLENRPLLKEERNRARTITRGIEGFGSFYKRSSSDQAVLQESSPKSFAKCNSQFNEHGNQEENISLFDDRYFTNGKLDKKGESCSENSILAFNKKAENSMSLYNLYGEGKLGNDRARTSFKENKVPIGEDHGKELDEWDTAEESNALLGNQKADSRTTTIPFEDFEDDHPFNLNEQLNNLSLLSSTNRVLQAF